MKSKSSNIYEQFYVHGKKIYQVPHSGKMRIIAPPEFGDKINWNLIKKLDSENLNDEDLSYFVHGI